MQILVLCYWFEVMFNGGMVVISILLVLYCCLFVLYECVCFIVYWLQCVKFDLCVFIFDVNDDVIFKGVLFKCVWVECYLQYIEYCL